MACVYNTPPISALQIECQYVAVRITCGSDWVVFQASCMHPTEASDGEEEKPPVETSF